MAEFTKKEKTELMNCLLDMGQLLLECGAEISRVEDTLSRMARAYGCEHVEVFVITSFISLSVSAVWDCVRALPTASLFCRSESPRMAGLKKNTRRTANRIISLRTMSQTSGFPQVMFRNPSRYREAKKENNTNKNKLVQGPGQAWHLTPINRMVLEPVSRIRKR